MGPEPGNVFGQGKDVPRIAMAHDIPYVATATVADLHDLERKVERAMEFHGARYLHVLVPCPLGWGSPSSETIHIARLAQEFASRGVEFWLIYPDASETESAIAQHKLEYKLPGTPVRDPQHLLVKRAEATISPQAAVFDHAGHLTYSGRIDDRYVAFGKARSAPQTHDLESAIAATLDGKPIKEPRTHSIGCYLADVK